MPLLSSVPSSLLASSRFVPAGSCWGWGRRAAACTCIQCGCLAWLANVLTVVLLVILAGVLAVFILGGAHPVRAFSLREPGMSMEH